jgi:hypothetical protein
VTLSLNEFGWRKFVECLSFKVIKVKPLTTDVRQKGGYPDPSRRQMRWCFLFECKSGRRAAGSEICEACQLPGP